jgi:hypothetical protein
MEKRIDFHINLRDPIQYFKKYLNDQNHNECFIKEMSWKKSCFANQSSRNTEILLEIIRRQKIQSNIELYFTRSIIFHC